MKKLRVSGLRVEDSAGVLYKDKYRAIAESTIARERDRGKGSYELAG